MKAVGNNVSDNVSIALLDEFGTAIETYTWNDWMFANPCWIDESYEPLTSKALVPGQALWVQGSSAQQNIQSSGEVGADDAVVKLQAGYTIAGNPFPVSVLIQDILPIGTGVSDNVSIALLDEFGTAVETYTWNDWMLSEACWIDESYEPATGSISAGQGLWIQGASAEQFVRFPAPEL